jgi:endonuclease YncB( thermonuclease family)
MGWGRSHPRSLWRTLLDTIVFLSVLFIVLMVMNRFNLIDLGQVDLGSGEYAVIDGDSLRKGQTEIRLVGIDAPEYRQSCSDRNGAAYDCGKEAATALRQLVNRGPVNCESHELDRYRRALSTCRIKDLNINQELVRQGWAVAYTPHGVTFDYVADEAEARRMKRGLWRGTFETPSAYRKRQRAVLGNAAGGTEPDD